MTKTYICMDCGKTFQNSEECIFCKSKNIKRVWKNVSSDSSTPDEVKTAIDLMKYGGLETRTRSKV